MNIDIVVHAGLPHQADFAALVATGLCRHDIKVRVISSCQPVSADVVICWGWRQGEPLRQAGKQVLVMERGYIADRFEWTSFGWNGLNGRASWPQIADGGDRFREHFADFLKPERDGGGEYILVLGQVPGDASLIGIDINLFYLQAAAVLAERFALPIRFRPHPVHVERGFSPGTMFCDMPVTGGTLDEDLAGASFAVAWNSNALTDAAMAGVPVIAIDLGAMVWPIAGHGLIAEPALRDRELWVHRMAWRQWNNAEIESGEFWDAVKTVIEDPR